MVKTSAGLLRCRVAVGAGDSPRFRIGPPELVPVQSQGEGIARSADGQVIAAAGLDNGVAVWRREFPYDALRLPQSDCRHVAVSPDGRLVAAGSWHGRGIKVWEVDTGRLVRTLLPDSGATVPAFSPDGKWLTDARGLRWKVADWSEGPKAPPEVSGCAFSPDGKIAAWAKKGFVVLTDPETGRELARLEDPHQDGLAALTFSRDGTLLLGPTNDGFCVRVWDLRKIRAGLVELGLDWAMPPYPPPGQAASSSLPLQVTLVGQNLLTDPAAMQRAQRERALLALWLDPFDVESRLALGETLLTANRVWEANAQFTAAIALRPSQIGGYRLRARARLQLGDWDGCVADATIVLARSREPLTHWHRGLAHARLGRHADAVADLTVATEFHALSADLYLERGEVYLALGKENEAAADWKRAADLAADARADALEQPRVALAHRPGRDSRPKASPRTRRDGEQPAAR